jgi:leucyl-tRNA synthetase
LGRAVGWKYKAPPKSSPKGRTSNGDANLEDDSNVNLNQNQDSEQVWDYELSTMPGWAGSSWYFYRYMDAQNENEFASKKAIDYWQQVDLYVGGSEHATGHLLYSRFWNQFLYDLGLVPHKEYAKKLINQGMIQGRSLYLRLKTGRKLFVNVSLADEKDRLFKNIYETMIVSDNRFEGINAETDIEWQTDERGQLFVPLKPEVEKMSKRTLNVVNPDDMVDKYGADCFRMYEMFLGPIDQAKPWDTNGISGVSGFLKKLWAMIYDNEKGAFLVTDEAPNQDELKALHQCIKDVTNDIERFSVNTCISNFMKCVNELRKLNCSKRLILKEFAILLAPFAPYTAEEIWAVLGNEPSVHHQNYPIHNDEYLASDTVDYPIAVNGKTRDIVAFPTNADQAYIESAIMANEKVQKHLEGKPIKKIVFVKGRMVNIVI